MTGWHSWRKRESWTSYIRLKSRARNARDDNPYAKKSQTPSVAHLRRSRTKGNRRHDCDVGIVCDVHTHCKALCIIILSGDAEISPTTVYRVWLLMC